MNLIKVRNKKGTTLIISYLVIMVLLILGIAFTARSIVESRIAERQKIANQAFCIAEAGLERALHDLKEDFEHSPEPPGPSLLDDTIYTTATTEIDLSQGDTVTVPQNFPNFYDLPYGTAHDENSISTALGEGSFAVQLANVAGEDNAIWVRSTGTVGDISRTVQAYVRVENISPWQNVIFAGAGQAGSIINGNVDIRGSVHILATNLAPGDVAIEVVELGGDGRIGNNYNGMDPALEARIPACPTVVFNGENVESLSATVRVRRGLVALSGNATLGAADVPENDVKETVDAVFVTDGYGGNKGAENVYSDNGTENPYDLGDGIQFPSLSDEHPDNPGQSYLQYLGSPDNAYIIDGSKQAQLDQMADIAPDSIFTFGDANGQISMDGNGNMTISGTVYIDGPFTMEPGNVTYTGKGIIVSTGDVSIESSLLTPAGVPTFPATNLIGIMTPNNVTLGGAAQIDIMGAFYAEKTLTINMQTNVLGSAVANYFDMGGQVPNIYQVPNIDDNLPEGMINGEPAWVILTVVWQNI